MCSSDLIIAVLEPRSNTMKMGVHQHTLLNSLATADDIYVFEPANLGWSLKEQAQKAGAHCYSDIDELVADIVSKAAAQNHILVMSNGGFGGIHQKLLNALGEKETS